MSERPSLGGAPEPVARAWRERVFLAHLGTIERVALAVAARRGWGGADAAAFAAWARLRLADDGYRLLAGYTGETAFATYLAVLVGRLAHEHGAPR